MSKTTETAVAPPPPTPEPAPAPVLAAAPVQPVKVPFWSRMAARFDDLVAEPTPAVAVEFAAGRLAVGRQGGPIHVRALPSDAIVASAVRTNLFDPSGLAAQLRLLLEAAGGADASVTLLLPDLTARVSVLDFDILPAHRQEIEALARFRLRKSLPFADEQAVISAQVLSPTRLLVTVADRARVNEYEDCLEAAGARAVTVIPSGVACLAAQPVLDHGALLIRAESACLTTAFCLHGKVEFFRAIELNAPASFEDVFPSIAFFRDRAGHDHGGADDAPLLLAGANAELEARLREEIPWAQVRVLAAAGELAVAGALQGRFA
ncbi:MAG TPA: hypothetical protein VNE83_08945 [Terriglobales bacterium]|nr:hypothetical protein [Terriglobales bacterium]